MAVAGIRKSLTEICILDEVKKDTEVTRSIISCAQILQVLEGENLESFARLMAQIRQSFDQMLVCKYM